MKTNPKDYYNRKSIQHSAAIAGVGLALLLIMLLITGIINLFS